MAQAKKKGLIARLIEGTEKSEGYARAHLPSNRWELFWDIFKGRLGKLFIINLLMILFLLPIFLFLFLRTQMISFNGTLEPTSQNIGIGYPAIPVLIGRAEAVAANANFQFFALLPLFSLIGAVGLSGGFYVIRNMVWTEGIFVANDFWRGIKQNYFVIMITALIYSVFLGIASYTLSTVDILLALGEGNKVLLWIAKGSMYVFIGFITMMAMYMCTMGVTYQLKFFQLVKNAFLLTVALLPTNLLFLFLAMLPILISMLGGIFMMIGIMLLATIGFSLLLLVWTDYSHWVFDKFINDRVPGAEKNRGIYEKVSENDSEAVKQYKMQVRELSKSNLTSRPIKPITDKELHLAELPATFNRADLRKLAASKDAIVKDNEEYIEKHKHDEKYVKLQEELKKIEDEERAEQEAKKDKKRKKSADKQTLPDSPAPKAGKKDGK